MAKIVTFKTERVAGANGVVPMVKISEVGNSMVEYDVLRKEVGGLIELANFSGKLHEAGIDMFCDEEGKLKELLPTMFIFESGKNKDESELIDVVCGNIVFVSRDVYGDSYGLSDEQINLIKQEVKGIVLEDNGAESKFLALYV